MSDSRTSSLTGALLSLSVAFDAGQLTSDGGLVWLAQADDRLGLSAAFAAQLRDWRHGPVRHPLALLVRQRILQIACGYEDQDDADTLRRDPLRPARLWPSSARAQCRPGQPAHPFALGECR